MRFRLFNAAKQYPRLSLLSNSYANVSRRLLKYPWNFVKINCTVLWAPVKSIFMFGAAYSSFCFGYSVINPQEWPLSDHCIFITNITRVSRTLFNAFMVFLFYKYYFWGIKKPESKEEPGFGPDNEANKDRQLTDEEEKYNQIFGDFLEICCKRMVNVILSNGGVYLKVGQGMATFSAMLPAQLSSALKPLLESDFERQSGEVEHMFVQDLGDKPANVFAEISPDPVAAASIAQVFVGTTKEGTKVAIKVQYHDISKRFRTDKWAIMFVMRRLAYFNPDFPLLAVMPHIFDGLEKELDFIIEGKNAEQCSENLKYLDFLVVPKVHKNLSSQRILTMDWADGINLVDTDLVKAAGFNPREIMEKVIQIFSEQIFKTGLIHCDPHPGNIMVRKNKVTSKTEIVLIDHGLYEQLPNKVREAFARFWHSVIIEDDDEVQRSGKMLGLNYPDILATMLFLKPYGTLKSMQQGGGFGRDRRKRKKLADMSEEEKAQSETMRNMGKDTVHNMPRQLALVFRNIRLIQGINLRFGVPVNRTRLMAKIAVKNSAKEVDLFTAMKLRLKFEWYFFLLDLRNRTIAFGVWFYNIFFAKQETKEKLTQGTLFLQA